MATLAGLLLGSGAQGTHCWSLGQHGGDRMLVPLGKLPASMLEDQQRCRLNQIWEQGVACYATPPIFFYSFFFAILQLKSDHNAPISAALQLKSEHNATSSARARTQIGDSDDGRSTTSRAPGRWRRWGSRRRPTRRGRCTAQTWRCTAWWAPRSTTSISAPAGCSCARSATWWRAGVDGAGEEGRPAAAGELGAGQREEEPDRVRTVFCNCIDSRVRWSNP
ncbi:hypothetical protein C2845_PM05G17770 [Panicum miliaceum]|uniref:Uncharacterized protein n=1 Tax=Panicum miliaceum TaxID=4540 RepID=A0A3L6SZ44_PANMI|nr:hypothetical protein C2845_PM05G17770 [Panicum miliaceum]